MTLDTKKPPTNWAEATAAFLPTMKFLCRFFGELCISKHIIPRHVFVIYRVGTINIPGDFVGSDEQQHQCAIEFVSA